jgi:hypothetical protein
MAITNYEVTSSTASAAFTASADTAVTVIYLCNINSSTPDGDASVDVYVVPNGESVAEKFKIYNGVTVQGTDTYIIDTEKLILESGDRIFIATPDSTGQVKATISTIGL